MTETGTTGRDALVMSRLARLERRERVLRLGRDGVRPSDIAMRVGLTTNHVNTILREGVPRPSARPAAFPGNTVDAMWELDEARRRREILRRAARGARATLMGALDG